MENAAQHLKDVHKVSNNNNDSVRSIDSATASTSTSQTQLKQASKNKRKQWSLNDRRTIEVDLWIFNMIVTDMHPMSMVEDPGFIQFLKKAWPQYRMKSRKYLSNDKNVAFALPESELWNRFAFKRSVNFVFL